MTVNEKKNRLEKNSGGTTTDSEGLRRLERMVDEWPEEERTSSVHINVVPTYRKSLRPSVTPQAKKAAGLAAIVGAALIAIIKWVIEHW